MPKWPLAITLLVTFSRIYPARSRSPEIYTHLAVVQVSPGEVCKYDTLHEISATLNAKTPAKSKGDQIT